MKRTKKTRIGASLIVFAIAFAFFLVGSAPSLPAKSFADDPSVIAGTTFREPGFALPGVEVTLTLKTPPEKGKAPKPQKLKSDARGEFAFRVPSGKAVYLVTVKASGYVSQEKAVELAGGSERVDVYFTLKSEAPGQE